MQGFALPSALALAAALVAMPALASNPGPFSTGLDADGLRLAQDAVDPHYQIVGSPLFGPAAYAKLSGAPIDNGAWVDDSGASSWLVPALDFFFTDQPGLTDTITYRTQFDHSAFCAPGWRIDGRWAADDSGLSITLNGVTLADIGVAQADRWTSFSLSDGILPGLNTLEFTTRSTVSPTGLRVELTTAAVPEPSAWLLMTAGVGMLGLLARRRQGAAQ